MIANPPLPFAPQFAAAEISAPAASAVRRRRPLWPRDSRWVVLETFRPATGCPRDGRCTFCARAEQCNSPSPAA